MWRPPLRFVILSRQLRILLQRSKSPVRLQTVFLRAVTGSAQCAPDEGTSYSAIPASAAGSTETKARPFLREWNITVPSIKAYNV